MGMVGRELTLLPLAFAILATSVAGYSIGENTRNNCIKDEYNATVPRCSDWIGPGDQPIFFPHQYNCSKYWECNVAISQDYAGCLRECASCGSFDMCDGHPALFFDEYEKPGPTCDYPSNTNCTARPPECAACEAWQDCTILDDGTVVCTPDCIRPENCDGFKCPMCNNGVCEDPECCDNTDCPVNYTCEEGKCQGCLVDEDCADAEYCDNGACKLGCRDNDISTCSMPCSECVNHVCQDPECCVDPDCKSTEYCTVDNICNPGCRDNDISTCALPCSECVAHVCQDPECCVDPDCKASEFCNVDNICEEGCNEDSDCTGTNCSTCDMSLNKCEDPECCVDDDCKGGWTCEDGKCKPECVKDDDCDTPEYCDTVNGICKIGCRDNDISTCAMPCSECVAHVCQDPECCVDPDCKNAEYCTVDNICNPGCRDGDISTCAMPCSECVANVCQDPECCKDPDCKGSEFCNVDNICQEGCNEDSDCIETSCSTCDMSLNKCEDPECCVNEDCMGDDKPFCVNYECTGCTEDSMCPDVDNVCDINSYSNCDYCNMEGSTDGQGKCDDGCSTNDNCPNEMACQEHVCTTGGSSVTLKSITFKTVKCQGCDSTNVEQWLTMYIEGKPDIDGKTNCTTAYLDHPNKQDYAEGTTVTFVGKDDKTPLGGCYLKKLQSEVRKLEVTWSGEGTWSAEDAEIIFEMSDEKSALYMCKLNGGDLSPSNPTSDAVCNEFFP